jgi:DNA polymerase I-like protein with 3'-5' exonuclease and polymerase domains
VGLWDTRQALQQFHQALPFVQTTFNYYAAQAKVIGEVRTCNGRRRKFESWAPFGQYFGLPREAAEAKWPGERLRRTETHKGLNQRLQGGGADIMKLGMLNCWEAGIYDVTGFPLVTVHDELGFSAVEGEPLMEDVQNLLETCAPSLKVPLVCEPETGGNWGECG